MHEITQPKAIIFDCWSTILYTRSQAGILSRLSMALLRRRMGYSTLKRLENSLMRHPETDSQAAARRVVRDLHLPPLPQVVGRARAIIEAQNRMHAAFDDSFSTLTELRKDYKLGLLSNTHQILFDPVRAEYKLDDYFDVIVPSFETGHIKPEPEIFELILGKLGVKPDEAVMVGDNLRDDVYGAEGVGMRGILVDRRSQHPRRRDRVTALAQLPEFLKP
jgi:2-haloalkanoic acid dehalogenase type II